MDEIHTCENVRKEKPSTLTDLIIKLNVEVKIVKLFSIFFHAEEMVFMVCL